MDGQTKDDMNVRRRQYIQLQRRDYNDEKWLAFSAHLSPERLITYGT